MIAGLSRRLRPLQRFAGERRGATAVEFSILALPFFALIFATFELGLVFMVQTGLENAIDNASRKIRTGELQQGSGDASSFKSAVCNELSWLGSGCTGALTIDVRTYPKFADINPPGPIKDGKVDTGSMTFTAGGPEDIVLVRAFYQWKLISPVLTGGLNNLGNGDRLISAAVAFRNEPYQ